MFYKKTRRVVKILEHKFPVLGKFITKNYRFLRFYFYYKPYFFINKIGRKNEDPFRIYWIDPKKVKYSLTKDRPNFIKDKGKAIDGDWDTKVSVFKDASIYKAIEERIIKNKKWEETNFYKQSLEKIKNGSVVNGCVNSEQLKDYFDHLDRICDSIKNEGYKLNSQIKLEDETNKNDDYYKKLDEITICINRNGTPLFYGGRHRLSIAKVLGINKVPVMVVARHKKWADFKKEISSFAKGIRGGKLYQPAYYFDLEDIPYSYGEERFKLIKDNISLKSGTVLDIGANFGYFCHKLEEVGFKCTAVERNPSDVYFMKKLRDANENKFEIIQDSIFNLKLKNRLNYDIVLALYIFHHFIKEEKTYKDLVNFLQKLECKAMFLGTHNPQEKQMRGAYKNYEPEEFVKFIINNSCLDKYKLLYKFDNNRALYKIYK